MIQPRNSGPPSNRRGEVWTSGNSLPSIITFLGDVQILETSAFASGGFAELWRGSFQGQLVAIKSLRRYSSQEFDSAEVGIVSSYQPVRLGHR